MGHELIAEDARPDCVVPDGQGAWKVAVWVQPGAAKEGPAGEYQGCAKLRIAARAVDNKANKGLVACVARLLDLKKNHVTLVTGHASRKKTLRIEADKEPDWSRLLNGTGAEG